MPRFDAFIGPTYNPVAYSIDSQITKNWYTEKTEREGGQNPFSLLRTPGRRLFCDPGLGAGAVRGLWSLDNFMRAVINDRLVEVFEDGTFTVYAGTVTNDGQPAYMAGNATQLFVVSGGNGYILDGTGLHQIASGFPTGLAIGAAMVDNYFLTGIRGTQFFQISALGDGLTWDAARKGASESSPDLILQVGAFGNEFWPFGSQTVQVFNDTGDLDFPFETRQDVVITRGIYAPNSLCEVAGSWYYVSSSKSGQGMVIRLSSYSTARISDFSIANAIRLMPRFDDAIGWTYEENDHIFYCLYFPTADQTWVYDVSCDQWHQRTWLDINTGVEHAHRARCSVGCFGKVIVGDRLDGKLYEMSMSYLDDAGDLIRRVRRTPAIIADLDNVIHSNFVIDGNMGLGLNGVSDPDDPTYDPKAMLRWSNDGGKTFGNEHWRGFGRIGEYKRRAIWRRLGYSRRRVYELTVTAPVDWAMTACYVNMKKVG